MENNTNPSSDSVRIYYENRESFTHIAQFIKSNLNSKPIVLCIGSDRCIGDCLGPLTGTFLSKLNLKCQIYGTLEKPVHAINLKDTVMQIKERYPKHQIIAVDACLGEKSYIGYIHAKLGSIHPGKGIGKKLIPVGDLSIVGIVDTIELNDFNNASFEDEFAFAYNDFFPMLNIRLNFVMKMAEVITKGLYEALR